MEAYQSLTNRVASMEELLRQSEATTAILLQRLRVVEEHIAVSESRHREEGVAQNQGVVMRMDRAFEGQGARMEAINGALQRQAGAVQVIEERLQGAFRAIDQKINGDVAACQQRLQAAESSLTAAVRGAEAALQAQATRLQVSEQQLRGDVLAVQQQLSAELVAARQRSDAMDATLRSAVAEAQHMAAGEVRGLAERMQAQLQSTAQSSAVAIAALDQRTQTELRALQQAVAVDTAAVRQRGEAQDVGTRDAFRALHAAVAGDIATVASRSQAAESAQHVSQQKLLAELAAHRQQIETVDANWRASLKELNERVRSGWHSLQTTIRAMESTAASQNARTDRRVDELQAEMRRNNENLVLTVDRKIGALDGLRDDVARAKASLGSLRDDQHRLQEDLRLASNTVERNLSQLRTTLEAAVRAGQQDMLERLKPLFGYRAEMHAAVSAAANKVWSDASSAFATLSDVNAVQKQIHVLDAAVRHEVSLLAENGRDLSRRAEELRQRHDAHADPKGLVFTQPHGQTQTPIVAPAGVTQSLHLQQPCMQPVPPPPPPPPPPLQQATHDMNRGILAVAPQIPPPNGTVAIIPTAISEELNSVWIELRHLQRRLGMPREEVLETIAESRRQILDVALCEARRAEEEFREVLNRIEEYVKQMLASPRLGDVRSARPKKTVVRVVPRSEAARAAPDKTLLPPLVKLSNVNGDAESPSPDPD